MKSICTKELEEFAWRVVRRYRAINQVLPFSIKLHKKMKPKIGQIIKHSGLDCRIIAIHKFGTIDIQEVGGQERCWRMSGLNFL